MINKYVSSNGRIIIDVRKTEILRGKFVLVRLCSQQTLEYVLWE
jgi:hypothetical protein